MLRSTAPSSWFQNVRGSSGSAAAPADSALPVERAQNLVSAEFGSKLAGWLVPYVSEHTIPLARSDTPDRYPRLRFMTAAIEIGHFGDRITGSMHIAKHAGSFRSAGAHTLSEFIRAVRTSSLDDSGEPLRCSYPVSDPVDDPIGTVNEDVVASCRREFLADDI